MRFVGLNYSLANPSLQSFKQPVPENARHVASFDNTDGFTDLLVSADTIWWRSAVDCFIKPPNPYQRPFAYQPLEGEMSSRTLSPLDLKQFFVAQAGDNLSLWTLDHHSLLSYQEFRVYRKPLTQGNVRPSPSQELSSAIPLLERGSYGDRFACILNPHLGQKLFVLSGNGTTGATMSMLQQNVETRIWQSPIDIMIRHSDQVREFLSHTISIQVEDESKVPLHGQELLLCCSTSAEMLVNGVSTRGSLTGTVMKTDERGSLTVIIPADGIAAPLLTVKDPPSSSSLLHGRIIDIDPMQKLWDEMAPVETAQDLLNLLLADGTPLVKAGMSNEDLRKAAKSIQDLRRVRQDLASRDPQAVTLILTPANRQWGAWFWIMSKIEEVYEWGVEKIDNAYRFVVKIAGQAWNFLLENVPQVAAATEAVLGVIGDGWKWVKEKFQELIPCNDILSVKNALVNITTAGLILGSDVFANLEEKVDECFDGLRQKVRHLKNTTLPKALTDIRISQEPPEPADGDSDKIAGLLKSPQVQYGNYHLQHSVSKQGDVGAAGSILDRKVKPHSAAFINVCRPSGQCGRSRAEIRIKPFGSLY